MTSEPDKQRDHIHGSGNDAGADDFHTPPAIDVVDHNVERPNYQPNVHHHFGGHPHNVYQPEELGANENHTQYFNDREEFQTEEERSVSSSRSNKRRLHVGFLQSFRFLAMFVATTIVAIVLALFILTIQPMNDNGGNEGTEIGLVRISDEESGVITDKGTTKPTNTAPTTPDSPIDPPASSSFLPHADLTPPSAPSLDELPSLSSLLHLPSLPTSPESSPSPLEMPVVSTKAPAAVDLQSCVCDKKRRCSDIVYSTLTICLSLGGNRELSLQQIQLLNVTHATTSTVFQVIYPIATSTRGDSARKEGEPMTVLMSPFAKVDVAEDQKSMTVQLETEGLRIWFDLFMGSMIDIDGRVEIEEGEEEEEGKMIVDGNSRSLSNTRQIFENFHISARLIERPSPAPSVAPSMSLLRPCVCDSQNECYLPGEFAVSEHSPWIRICLSLLDANDDTITEINRLTYLKLEQEGGFPFEYITGDAVSPFAKIETLAVDDGVDDNVDYSKGKLVISVKLLPVHFAIPSAIEVYGIAEVTAKTPQNIFIIESSRDYDGNTTEIPWELTVLMERTEITPTKLPSVPPAMPPLALALEACQCDEEISCLQEPLVKNGSDNITPKLRICIGADQGDISSMVNIISLEIVQDKTTAVLSLINKEGNSRMASYHQEFIEGKIVITVSQISIFFSPSPPLPDIIVKGSAQVGDSGNHQHFAVLIPLEITGTGDGIPSRSPTIYSNSPSDSSLPSYVKAPSYSPSASPTEQPASPSSNPSTSSPPSVLHDPSVTACVCDLELIDDWKDVCKEEIFSEDDRNLHVCLFTRPHDVELVTITLMAIAQTYRTGKSLYSVLISPSSTFVDQATSVTYYENDPRRAVIITSIDPKFFLGIPFGETRATLQGSALTKRAGFTQRDLIFSVDLNMISAPSSQPSMIPSKSVLPSALLTSKPSSVLNGLPNHVEVWACQCRNDKSCSSDLLTQFNNEARLCIFSTHEIHSIELFIFQGEKSNYQIMEDDSTIIKDRSSLKIEIEGTQGTIVSKIPEYFFEGMESLTPGKALGIAIIKSASGGKSEVGFHADFNFFFQLLSSPPTRSPPPSIHKSNPPSFSAHPSHHPSLMGSYEPSKSPSSSPSTTVVPTVLRNESIQACQCDKSRKCVENPLLPSSRKVMICLLPQPQAFNIETIVLLFLEQRGVEDDHQLISGDAAIGDIANITNEGRRRLIETMVPSRYFINPSENLQVNGIVILNQTLSSISRAIRFSTTLTLVSEPSEAPSASPSSSFKPTFKGHTVSPTQSREPSLHPSKSTMPTEEQTIGLIFCPCNIQHVCVLGPVLTVTERSIRICVQVSPTNAEIKDLIATVSTKKKFDLKTQVNETVGNVGSVFGIIPEDFFEIGPLDDVLILGKVDIFVQQGNKGAEIGYSVRYKLESLTISPSGTPSISAFPTGVPPLGVLACQCDSNKSCTDDAVQSKAENVQICIRSTPRGLEFRIESLFVQFSPNEPQLAIRKGSVTANVAKFVELNKGSNTTQIVKLLKEGFFPDVSTSTILIVRGFASVTDPESITSTKNTPFTVEVQIQDEPTDMPSLYPSIEPTPPPTASPSNSPTGQPTQPPTVSPTHIPTGPPSQPPTRSPTDLPTQPPAVPRSQSPTDEPIDLPTQPVSGRPSSQPSVGPTSTGVPSSGPSESPSVSAQPSSMPSEYPSISAGPSSQPSTSPTSTGVPRNQPSTSPRNQSSASPSKQPSTSPSKNPFVSCSEFTEKGPCRQHPSCYWNEKPNKNFCIQNENTISPTSLGTLSPTKTPSTSPSSQPSSSPSNQPSISPTKRVSCYDPTKPFVSCSDFTEKCPCRRHPLCYWNGKPNKNFCKRNGKTFSPTGLGTLTPTTTPPALHLS